MVKNGTPGSKGSTGAFSGVIEGAGSGRDRSDGMLGLVLVAVGPEVGVAFVAVAEATDVGLFLPLIFLASLRGGLSTDLAGLGLDVEGGGLGLRVAGAAGVAAEDFEAPLFCKG